MHLLLDHAFDSTGFWRMNSSIKFAFLIRPFPLLKRVAQDELFSSHANGGQLGYMLGFAIDDVVNVRYRAAQFQGEISDGQYFSKNGHGDPCLHEWPTSTR